MPGIPGCPLSPRTPGAPGGPESPGSPAAPGSPGAPRSAVAPRGPGLKNVEMNYVLVVMRAQYSSFSCKKSCNTVSCVMCDLSLFLLM